MPLDLGWVNDVRVNASAVERRAATMVARRTLKKEWQAAWLLRAVTLLDLTTLAGNDTPGNVRRLDITIEEHALVWHVDVVEDDDRVGQGDRP